MAKKNQVYIDVIIDDQGTTKRVAVDAKKLGMELDKAGAGAEKTAKGQDKLNKTNKDLDRNMRGAAKMTSNSTKEFSKMRQGMGGLVGAYATLAAQVFAVSAAFQFLRTASEFSNLIAGQEALGAVTGTAYRTITDAVVEATDAQLKFADAARGVAIATATGLSASQIEKLGQAAKNASFALGRDLTDSYNRLIRGVTKAEPELLDELGIILRLERAMDKYKTELGITGRELTAFERSQAVANEVLEQTERKFGMMEGMMDPNAAALERFAKSFDDLFNNIRVGLIDTLRPLLTFLSKNTFALVAALSLFSLPIIKAIIPSMHEWRQTSEDLYDEHDARSQHYLERSKEQSAALIGLSEDEKELKKATKETALARGKKVDKGGIGYVAGGTDTPQARAAAKKGLKLAQADLIKHGEVRNGIFKNFTAREVQIAQASYNKRSKMVEAHTQKIKREFDRMVVKSKAQFFTIQSMWAKTMMGMRTLAMGAATAINFAMSLAGLLGTLALVGSAIKAIYDMFNPLSEEAKKQVEQIEELGTRYASLAIEMKNAAEGRQLYLSGSGMAESIGKTLQSADLPKIIKDLNTMAKMTDKSSDSYIKLRIATRQVLGILMSIDKEAFGPLMESFLKGTRIINTTQQEVKKAANSYIEIGQVIGNLPETIGVADKAFQKLYTSMMKPTPVDTFLQAEATTREDLETKKKAAKENLDILSQQQADNDYIMELMAAADAEFLSHQDAAFAERFANDKAWAKRIRSGKERAAFTRHDKQYDIDFGGASPEIVARARALGDPSEANKLARAAEKNAQATRDAQTDITSTLTKRAGIEDKLLEIQKEQREAAALRAQDEADATNNLVRGVTIQGKLNNLSLDEVKNKNKLAKAEEKLSLATKIKALANEDDKDLAESAYNMALASYNLAKAQSEEAQDKVDSKREELFLEQAILAIKIAQMDDADAAAQAANRVRRAKGLGGGTYESQAQVRTDETTRLQSALDKAGEDATAAALEYATKYEKKLQELKDLHLAGGPPNKGDIARFEQQAADETRDDMGDSVKKTQRDKDRAQTDYDLYTSIDTIYGNTLTKKKQDAEINLQSFSMLKEHEAVNREILRLQKLGVDVTQEQGDAWRETATETEALMRQKKNMDGFRDTLEQGFASAFEGIITGAKSAKEAFADMAKSMLAYLAKVIAQELALKAVRGIMGMMADGGISAEYGYAPIYAAKGRYGPRNFSKGGTARGPKSGYNARLHGNEAVVPLPHNRKIPVELNGGAGGGTNNVTVNVSMDGQGGSQQNSQSNTQMGKVIGEMVAASVQEELQHQKRSGGILNPYGAA